MLINNLFEKRSNQVYIIAEIAQNHDGSLGQAHAFIDACAQTGVDAIKFQTHIAHAESMIDEPFRVCFSYEDKTRYDYWKRMEFTEEQWISLKQHAEDKRLDFLSSVFSVEAFQLLDRIGVQAWKLGSGEVFNSYLLKMMADTGKPIIMSTGMSTFEDIQKQVNLIKSRGNKKYAILQCTTQYPNSFENVGLNVIDILRHKYQCHIGLSDHTGTIFPSLAAVVKGATIIEVHVTMSKYMFGPDVKASVTIEELQRLVQGIRAITTMLDCPVEKSNLEKESQELKNIFSKGIYANGDIANGDIINISNISFKKPLKGISAERYEDIIGKRTQNFIKNNDPIKIEDIMF